MSYHFGIKKKESVSYKSILKELNRDDVRIAYSDEINLNEELSGYNKFYIPKKSSRGITVGLEESEFDIGINVLASKEDYSLACELAKSIAKVTNSKIEPEDEENALTIDEFSKTYNSSWVENYKTQGLSMIKHLIKEEKDTITIRGCLRNYYIGPDLLTEFSKDNYTEEEFYSKIINSIRRVQFIDEKAIKIPNRFEVTEKDESKWEYIVITPNQEQLLLKTEFVMLYITDNEYQKVSFDEIEKYAKSNFIRLDEKQYLFPNLSIDNFNGLMEFFGYRKKNDENGQRKWWQFWK